ncbi:ubiquinol oxidase subunit II [Sphingomonas sp. BK580]|uniref:ubiquinol oxidase subunit II n=1 Tax=Sphingomonas sp. BK580 TaxID=2586972 RepID=UPI001608B0B7|nr:ubiquinol oxidase subunit II [Sphingomonas sp. BK580]MBB3695217.1 cytochrome o ubiquinol oxidase subunit 2 [Sphingomonas sp. BK580]
MTTSKELDERRRTRRRGLSGAPTRLARLAVMIASSALTGCTGVIDPQGPVGRTNLAVLLIALAVMLVVVLPTICAAVWFAWWYRGSNPRARRRPDFVYSGRIELVVWSIPLLIVLFLGGIAWIGSHILDPYRPLRSPRRPIEVQAVALDWKWLFIYPEAGVASVNALAIPAGTPVRFRITSASVMNTFFVPQLGSMIYAMNGMATQLNLQADRPGTYRGMSAHFSGDGFPGMHFPTVAMTDADFRVWLGKAKSGGGTLDAGGYKALSLPSSDVASHTYGTVAPGLFDAIVDLRLAPAPGPLAPAAAQATSSRKAS